VDDFATRAELIATARSLLLRDGEKFTLTSLCKESGLKPAKLRRTFPTKATLISAVLNELLAESGGHQSGLTPTTTSNHDKDTSVDGLNTNPAPTRSNSDRGNNITTSQSTWTYIDDDWIDRRFRVVERAVDALELRVETRCGEQSNSIALLEQKLASAISSPIVPATIAELPPLTDEQEHQESNNNAGSINNVEIEQKTPASVESAPCSDMEAPLKYSPARTKMLAILETARGLASDVVPTERHILENTQFRFIAFTAVAFVILLLIAGLFWSDNRARAREAPTVTTEQQVQDSSSVALIDATGIPKPRSDQISISVRDLMARAKSGNALAQTALAEAFLRGDGVELNPLAAVRWSQAAAEQGEPLAQFILGTLYSNGIKPNPRLAVRWLFAAASQGNVKAMHNLGVAFLTGQGVTKDPVMAANWFSKAAHFGYRDSAFDLAVLYERGEGVAQSPQDALRWYDKASAAGDQEAAQRATFLRSNLSYADEK
jgi:hypothetical protein